MSGFEVIEVVMTARNKPMVLLYPTSRWWFFVCQRFCDPWYRAPFFVPSDIFFYNLYNFIVPSKSTLNFLGTLNCVISLKSISVLDWEYFNSIVGFVNRFHLKPKSKLCSFPKLDWIQKIELPKKKFHHYFSQQKCRKLSPKNSCILSVT